MKITKRKRPKAGVGGRWYLNTRTGRLRRAATPPPGGGWMRLRGLDHARLAAALRELPATGSTDVDFIIRCWNQENAMYLRWQAEDGAGETVES